jgi:hypothetical protein
MHDSRRGGRPRKNTAYQLVLVHLLIAYVFPSARNAIAELADPEIWNAIGNLVRSAHPDRPDLWVDLTVTLGRYNYCLDAYLSQPDGLRALSSVLEEGGVQLALTRLDLLDPDGPGSLTHLDITRLVRTDGTVIKPPSKYKPNTPVPSRPGKFYRADDDCRPYKEGGSSDWVVGTKLQFLSTRGPDWYRRAILSVDVVGKGGELPVLHNMIDRL